jgi:hypothetical protein
LELLCKCSFRARFVPAEKSLDFEIEDNGSISPGQIDWVTHVVTVYYCAFLFTLWTGGLIGRAFQVDANPTIFDQDLVNIQVCCA